MCCCFLNGGRSPSPLCSCEKNTSTENIPILVTIIFHLHMPKLCIVGAERGQAVTNRLHSFLFTRPSVKSMLPVLLLSVDWNLWDVKEKLTIKFTVNTHTHILPMNKQHQTHTKPHMYNLQHTQRCDYVGLLQQTATITIPKNITKKWQIFQS